jgi:uracil-DNA glycosylase
MASSPHFCRGNIDVAFVFSAPGDEERRQGRPVAGDTGTNLELALVQLHSALPMLLSSVHRYD